VEIHAQLNAGAKLFSRMTFNCLRDCRMLLILT
jgi:Glu-tRNA(Gln) amidotransferase subunit E-like FAD-binding protein